MIDVERPGTISHVLTLIITANQPVKLSQTNQGFSFIFLEISSYKLLFMCAGKLLSDSIDNTAVFTLFNES